MTAGLDEPLTPARIRAIAAARQVARFGKLLDPHLADELVDPARRRWSPQVGATVEPREAGVTSLLNAARYGDTLVLSIDSPPRTKKNHGSAFGIRQGPAYKRYLRDVIDAVAQVKVALGLPLPAIAYNCKATYYVDRYGEAADLSGLNQGLYDALQAAGVLVDDWCVRAADGTRIITGQPPRVDVGLQPLEPTTP